MPFCVLEKDRKTFHYFKQYVQFLESEHKTCLIVDNEIQAQEIRNHLASNGFSSDNHQEGINWIKNNGKAFRDYLNSIKIVYLIWKCMGNRWTDITWEEFLELEEKVNSLKPVCLDTIF